MKNLISSATQRNWDRLQPKTIDKLTGRANKKLSQKSILPLEYLSNTENVEFIEDFILFLQDHNWEIKDVLYSVFINLLKQNSLSSKPHIEDVVSEYNQILIEDILKINFPTDEYDLLGLIYQCLLLEGEKNLRGAYYTPYSIAKQMTESFNFESNHTFLDPCCGSGSFLLALQCDDPMKIFGVDNDPIAVMLAKFNMLLKYPHIEFSPQIYHLDYLKTPKLYDAYQEIIDKSVTYIATNPPWGAVAGTIEIPNEITSNETFSIYLVKN